MKPCPLARLDRPMDALGRLGVAADRSGTPSSNSIEIIKTKPVPLSTLLVGFYEGSTKKASGLHG